MLVRVFICCCSLATILCAPANKTVLGRTEELVPTVKKPHIALPDAIVKKTKYELRGKC